MLIAFIHNGRALLPEIAAYRRFFESKGLRTTECFPQEVPAIHPDIEWHFMGSHFRRTFKDNLVIHEFASLSSAPFRKLKDFAKRQLNTTPDFRIFQNEYTRLGMGFTDAVPWGYRSVFIFESPVRELSSGPPLFDFIYAGTLDQSREPRQWLRCFAKDGPLANYTVLVLSKPDKDLQQQFRQFPNIIFHGQVPPDEVAGFIRQCRYGINYQPDKEPFNRQPSGKLLAYLAAGVPVISTDYEWVRDFQRQYGGNYFFLNRDLSNFTLKNLEDFPFSFPDLREWQFTAQLKRSGIAAFLASKTGMAELALIDECY